MSTHFMNTLNLSNTLAERRVRSVPPAILRATVMASALWLAGCAIGLSQHPEKRWPMHTCLHGQPLCQASFDLGDALRGLPPMGKRPTL